MKPEPSANRTIFPVRWIQHRRNQRRVLSRIAWQAMKQKSAPEHWNRQSEQDDRSAQSELSLAQRTTYKLRPVTATQLSG